ncbi:hypothetical protein G6F56_012871 [Rhizopus delemar]|nr:hypothetical protein G6F56_012871 [Rhizopus delemar]
MRQVGLQEALEAGNEEPVSSSRPIPNSVISLPSDGPKSPQLWYPSGGDIELLDGEVMSGLEDATLKRCLLSYYQRISPEHVLVTLDSSTIQLAGQVWLNTNVYSSKIFRDKKHLNATADHYVLFEAGRYRR